MFKAFIAAALSAGLLTACASEADKRAEAARIEAEDDRNCQELGFEPGTEAYGNCRLKLREIRTKERAKQNSSPTFGVGIGVGTSF